MRYEYVRINGNKVIGFKLDKHCEIIDEYAKKGFRYVGYIPVEGSNNGKLLEIDLVFEKEE